MKIGILEDEAVWRDKVQACIEKYCKDNNVEYKIVLYKNRNENIENKDLDLLFLDIELDEGDNGFEIAERLMNSGSQCRVCFLTSHTELARLGYRFNAFRYIDKKHLEEINEAIDYFLKTKIQDRIVYCRDTAGINIKINLKELLLIETNGRKLRYLMLDGREYFCEGLISETAQSLSRFGFYHIQRSYVVNLKYIEAVNSREVTLCNGIRIVIGRAHGKEFKKAFFQWRMQFDS